MNEKLMQQIKKTQARTILDELSGERSITVKNTMKTLIASNENCEAAMKLLQHMESGGEIRVFKTYDTGAARKCADKCNNMGFAAIVVYDAFTRNSFFIIQDSSMMQLKAMLSQQNTHTGFLLESNSR